MKSDKLSNTAENKRVGIRPICTAIVSLIEQELRNINTENPDLNLSLSKLWINNVLLRRVNEEWIKMDKPSRFWPIFFSKLAKNNALTTEQLTLIQQNITPGEKARYSQDILEAREHQLRLKRIQEMFKWRYTPMATEMAPQMFELMLQNEPDIASDANMLEIKNLADFELRQSYWDFIDTEAAKKFIEGNAVIPFVSKVGTTIAAIHTAPSGQVYESPATILPFKTE